MTMAHSLQILAQVSAAQMLNCLVQGVAIAVLACGILRICGRTSAVTRFAVWFCALLAIVVLPMAGLLGKADTLGHSPAHAALTLPSRWALYLFAGWAALSGVALLKVVTGLYKIRQLRRACEPLQTQTLDPLLQETVRGFGSRRSVTLCTSDSLNVPAAIGFFNPAVVFPKWAMEELSVSELNSILLHELAHLARRDDWTNLTQKVARAIFFFHPAIWWIDSRLSLEREMACDDVVLARTANPRAYAECLVSLTEKGLLHRGFALAQAAISRMRQTTLRVTQILERNHPIGTRVGRPVFGALALALFGVSTLSPMTPKLVSFGGVSHRTSDVAADRGVGQTPSLKTVAFHPASTSLQTVTMVNATFHPDELSTKPPAIRAVKTAKSGVKRATSASLRHAATAPTLLHRAAFTDRTAITNAGISGAPGRGQVFVVVMQEHVYGADGQLLLIFSVYKFTSIHPDSSRSFAPKRI